MNFENFRKVAEMLYHDNPDALITLTGGEPTMHPDFKSILEFSRAVRLKIPSSNHTIADFLFCDPFFDFSVNH